jgi:AcrR family transcriptional regulator
MVSDASLFEQALITQGDIMADSIGQPEAESRRQRRINRRRRRILEAAAVIFAENGYANTTTKAIAEAADMAEGTLYNYFASKRDILLAVARETEAPMELAVLEVADLEERAAMIAMFEMAFSISETQLPFMRTLVSEAWVDDGILEDFVIGRMGRIQDSLQGYIASRIATGLFRPVDPALCARMAIGLFGALILPAFRGLEPLPSAPARRALAEAAVDLILNGLAAKDDSQASPGHIA